MICNGQFAYVAVERAIALLCFVISLENLRNFFNQSGKTKTNCDVRTNVFPRFVSATYLGGGGGERLLYHNHSNVYIGSLYWGMGGGGRWVGGQAHIYYITSIQMFL